MKRLLIAGLMVFAVACSSETGDPSAVAQDAPATDCLRVEEALRHNEQTTLHLQQGAAHAQALDVEAASRDMHLAAVSAEATADAVEADPTIADPMYEAAALFESASSKMAAVTGMTASDIRLIEEATADIEAASALVDVSAAAVELSTAERC